jgi:hypothetical protein
MRNTRVLVLTSSESENKGCEELLSKILHPEETPFYGATTFE